MVNEMFIKRKVSLDPNTDIRCRNQTMLMKSPAGEQSNRFFDTFTKFQKVNEIREVPSPSFKQPGSSLNMNNLSSLKGVEYQLKPMRIFGADENKKMNQTSIEKSKQGQFVTQGRGSIQRLHDTMRDGGRLGITRRSSLGSSFQIGIKNKDMTTTQKMNLFQLQQPAPGQPVHITEIVD